MPIYADMRTAGTVNIKAKLCKNSSFDTDVLTMSNNFSYSANTQNPGTAVLSGNAHFDFTTQAKQLFIDVYKRQLFTSQLATYHRGVK